MADLEFNISKGRTVELFNRVVNNDPADSALVLVLLQASESDAVLTDYDDLGTLLAAAGNDEADFTNYSRITLTDADLSLATPDDVNDEVNLDFADQTWVSAGGALNNTLTKLLICYDSDTTSGTDSDIVPLIHYDFAATTDGNNIVAQVAAGGFFTAT